MTRMRESLSEFFRAWNRFWFEKSDAQLLTLGVFRATFYSVMFFFYFTRAFDVEFFYSDAGIMPSWHRVNLEMFRYHPTILDAVKSIPALHAIHSLFLLFMLGSALGIFTRFCTIAAFVLHLMFINRNMSVMFGADMIGTFYMFYMCFARSGARFSIDRKLGLSQRGQSVLSHVAWRLMQIQLCVIYGFSGLEKLKGTRWWDGSALWDVLSIGNMQRWDLSFVANVPIALAANVYVVLFWEIYFPVLIWNKKLRNFMLFFGFVMHLGIFLFMNLPGFAFMMISLYILFLSPEDLLELLHKPRLVR